MKKILFTATVDSHIINFHLPYLKYFQDKGYEVHVASNGDTQIAYTNVKHNVPFQRSPYKRENILAYKELKKIITNNHFDLIHCHTPMGSVITRLAARKSRQKETSIFYTAHGFHFFKGAPLKNWLLFYPMEKWLSRYTDCLITINNEDYNIAKKKFRSKVMLINGVGINLDEFSIQTLEGKNRQRIDKGYNLDDFILIYVGELSYRKHQDLLIRAVNILKNKIPNIKLLLVGTGEKLEEYKSLSENLDLKDYVEFLGYRNDINNLMLLSDIAISSSRQEGLPVNIMEAISTGLPLLVSNCRGNRDLVINGENGYVFNLKSPDEVALQIIKLHDSQALRKEFYNKNILLREQFAIEKIMEDMIDLYNCK
ncbi:glycosyltransferase family 4 protein [Paenibacillus sp. FSL R5-0914]|uniref:glycosyltransferase family 4 protein n=1 Tax=Paenibacillus sp. FSL R5-0914 TaxID=2921665 RepID=UPI0030FB294E